MDRKARHTSGSPWEDAAGYSRAVRVGNTIEVSGTVAQEKGKVVGKGDPFAQTMKILEIIEHAIEQLGGRKADIVRTRMYVTDIKNDWEAVGKAHGTFFSGVQPATTMVEVSALIAPEYLVEIEATAILSHTDGE
jgi:enamine deaminase RidA (YjgF/YER057c/UK114 family)